MSRLYTAARMVVVFAAMIALTGCGQQPADKELPQLVKVTTVGAGQNTSEAQYAGEVRGRYESNLAFQAGGRISARNVQLGSRVKAGDVLMTVDPKDAAQSVTRSQAAVESAKAQRELAASNLSRYQALYQQNAVPAAVLDQYSTAYNQAVAAYDQAQATASQEENLLSYTDLTADADGVISALSGEVGQVVAAGQTVLTLVHTGDLEVQINVPENKVQNFVIGKEVSVSFWALQGQKVTGTVREVAPMANQISRTYKVSIALPDPPEDMQLGMTATVTNLSQETGDSEPTVILPLAAIYQTGNQAQVWIVGSDKTVVLKNVTVENFSDNKVKVTGLKSGDSIVTAGVHQLSAGQTVRTESEDQ
ncbi:MAG: efflux RND transporter periplasmic adaptor subunit [Megasphaera sp.]|jgi:RND family efflux transporter MFP subunit|uniref:efflux RND transporter periplasmic adaptor subunit n=1 Tax=Megasphaera sueciensis TaxID=349094 RepID=UPI003D06A1C8|nr:efflux RND transporter periplasmic adaptor subunit [Megasphaera sp.]MCI1823456.1 efflux RND transporter periplasmic adaptor subunit [Megasphaera sp.]